MKILLIIWLTCSVVLVTGQSIQQTINDQVWRPFISAYNNRDTDGFMTVHSKDVVRSPRDANMVLNWNEYFEQQSAEMIRVKLQEPQDNWISASQNESPARIRQWKSASMK